MFFLDKKVVVEKLRPHRKLLKDFYSDENDQPSDKGEIISSLLGPVPVTHGEIGSESSGLLFPEISGGEALRTFLA